jgi:N-methylhydantoinase B
MRSVISAIADGTFVAEDWVDGDGLDDSPVRVKASITIAGDTIIVDFEGTGEQTRGPINCPIAATESAVYFAVISMLAPRLAPNYGCYNPIKVVAPVGSVVNPQLPAPVVGRNVLAHRINNVVCAALGQALPERASAAYYGNSNVYILSAAEEGGAQNVLFEIEVGGWGGQRYRDGHDCLSAGIHNLMNNPIELTEQEFPARFVSYEFRADSGGAGRYRGGLGARREMEMLQDSKFSAQFDRMKFPPPGFAGGAPGATARISVIGEDGVRDLPGKVLAHVIKRGERLVIESQGGGGYGPPGERAPDALERDVAEGRVSSEAAKRDYR